MAATEEENNSASIPPYPEIILTAIAALGEKDGSSKSAITKYFEATYTGTLHEGYTAAISEALTKMKDSGELIFVNELYSKPDPNSAVRRGRGRPKKSKPILPPGALPPPRPRGRPPKPKDSRSTAVKAAGGTPRRRGRPPKPIGSNSVKATGGTPRRRGRPAKKHRPVVSSASRAVAKGDGTAPAVSGVKRGRGRPPKVKPTVAEVAAK